MFEASRVTRRLGMQNKAYGLFIWVNQSLRDGKSPYAQVSSALAFPDAAEKWLRTFHGSFPQDLRPEAEEREEVAHLFVSFLSTSFEILDGRVVGACGGCFCCGVLRLPRHLRARTPGRKAREEAEQMKILYLRGLAERLELPLEDSEIARFVSENGDLKLELAIATYVHELERRSRFATQGEGSLALWRQFAWADGSPKRKFQLTSKDVMKAESLLSDRLRAL